MANYLYVDNSNVWIEGMHVAAAQRGLVANLEDAQRLRTCDYKWKIDFGRLYEFAGGDASEVGKAVLYGSRPPRNDGLWEVAARKGFEVVVHDRNLNNREKKIDASVITDMLSDSYELMQPGRDEFTLVAGDKDYVPTVERLTARGFRFSVVFWGHAAAELRRAATDFVCLDPYFEFLNLNRATAYSRR